MKRVGRAGSLGVAADVRVTGVKAILYAGRPWAEACGGQVTWMVSCLVSLMALSWRNGTEPHETQGTPLAP